MTNNFEERKETMGNALSTKMLKCAIKTVGQNIELESHQRGDTESETFFLLQDREEVIDFAKEFFYEDCVDRLKKRIAFIFG